MDGAPIYTGLITIKPTLWGGGKALAFYADSLWSLLKTHHADFLVIENKIPKGAIVGNASFFDLATALFWRSHEVAARQNIQFSDVTSQTWRAFFLGQA